MAERLIASGKYDWIWWLDFDTLITNTDIQVVDVINEALANTTSPNNIDWLFTHDCNGLNAGSFIFRGHERSLQLIQMATELSKVMKDEGHGTLEQGAIVKLLNDDEAMRASTIVVPQQKLNAFPQEIACYDPVSSAWKDGDFVIHFAGAWAHVKGDDPTGQLMKKYEPHIRWGDWQDFY